jgi:hypothetical protein
VVADHVEHVGRVAGRRQSVLSFYLSSHWLSLCFIVVEAGKRPCEIVILMNLSILFFLTFSVGLGSDFDGARE